MVILTVAGMTCRHDVRVLSASIADVDGVVALQVDFALRTVRVEGAVRVEAVRAAITAGGYEAD